jgi:hypothetical protein
VENTGFCTDYLAGSLLTHLAYVEQELVEPLVRLGF